MPSKYNPLNPYHHIMTFTVYLDEDPETYATFERIFRGVTLRERSYTKLSNASRARLVRLWGKEERTDRKTDPEPVLDHKGDCVGFSFSLWYPPKERRKES